MCSSGGVHSSLQQTVVTLPKLANIIILWHHFHATNPTTCQVIMTSETYSLSYFNIAMQFYKEQLVKLGPQFCFFLVYSISRYVITFDIMHYCIPNKLHIKSLNLTGSLLSVSLHMD